MFAHRKENIINNSKTIPYAGFLFTGKRVIGKTDSRVRISVAPQNKRLIIKRMQADYRSFLLLYASSRLVFFSLICLDYYLVSLGKCFSNVSARLKISKQIR